MPNVPELRFPEFSGEWIEKRLGEITKIVMGQSPESRFYNKNKNGLPLIQGANDFNEIHNYTTQITKTCEKNDIIMSVRAPVGALTKAKEKFCIGRGVCAIKGNDFIYYLLIINQNKLKKYSQGSTFEAINSNDLKSLKILIPPTLAEQQKIASFLSSIDEKIDLQEQKTEQLEKYKKALLQKLFATKDKKVPELRFPEFSGEWVEKRLGELIEECAARNKNKQIENILSISNRQGFVSQMDFFDKRVASKDISNYKIVKRGWFAYNPARINVGSIALLRKYSEGIISPMYIVFKTKSNLNNIFLNYWLETYYFNEQLKKYLVGSVRQSLNIKDLKLIKILIPPTLVEQQKIASFLSAIDEKIELEKEKLDKIKKYKKGLLQKMFA